MTLQVTDAGSQSWNNGTWSVVLLSTPGANPFGPPFFNIGTSTPVPNQSQSGALGASGSASGIILTQNAGIVPANSQWKFTVCPQATSQCFSQFVTITAATSVTLAPPAISVNCGPGVNAYADAEVSCGIGGGYYNLTLASGRVCQAATGASCTTWANSGSGGGVLAGVNGGGIWQKMGTIINADPTSATDQGNSQEASVICEGSPQVLTTGETAVCGPPGTAATANAVLKMWFTCGFTAGNICYAEARPSHPTVWFRKAGTLITNHAHGRVFKNGSTYHEYACNNASSCTQIDHYTATDGVTFTLSASAVIGLGTAGQWDSQFLANNRVWIEGSTWYMLYEGIKAAGQWSVGIATSTDGAGNTWTKNTGVNPLCVGCGGPDKYKDAAGNYWIWTHSAPAGTSLPSDIFRWNLTGLTTTPALTANPSISVLPRSTFDEGWQSAGTGQLADISHVEVNGSTYAFYEGTYDGSSATAYLHMKVAVANIPWASVVTTPEGIAASGRPWDSSNGISVGTTGIPAPPGGISVNNSTNGVPGYLGLTVQQVTVGSSAAVGAIGVGEYITPAAARVRNVGSSGGASWNMDAGSTNANTGAFLSLISTGGVETFPINSGLNSNGNAQITLADTLSGGIVPTLTGTGACATFSGVATGGANAGQFTCTGTTGASTVTLTFNTTAGHGWACSASDITTTLSASQVTPIATTTCKLNFTSVTANDVITFQAKGY